MARAARDLGLEAFLTSTLPEVSEMLDSQQTWQLARMYWHEDRQALTGISDEELLSMATTHLGEFDHVGLTETFDSDFRRILSDLDIDQQVPAARQFKTVDPVSIDQLSSAALTALRERLGLDYALLAHARSLRQENTATNAQ